MRYRLRETGEVKTQGEIRALHPDTSLPKVWNENTLDFLQIDPVLATPKPETTYLQIAYVSGVELDSLGNWVDVWAVDDKYKDILDEQGNIVKTVAEQVDEYLDGLRLTKRESLKSEREVIEAEPINNFQVYRVDDQQKIEKAIKYFEQYQDANGQRLWVMADNSVKLVTKAELEALEALQVDKVDKAYTAYMQAVNVIQNSTDPDFIQSVTVGDYYNA